MTSGEPLEPAEQLRIVLLGKVGAGKTSVLNTLLRSSEENKKPASERPPETLKCETETLKIGGQKVVVMDTPGLCSTENTDEEVLEDIKRHVSLAAPGPHVFLLVHSCLDKFTKEGQDMVETMKKTFGEDVLRYTMTLFTCKDQLDKKGTTVQEFIKGDLKTLVDECNGGYHAVDNRDQNPSQVSELLQQIRVLVQRNGAKCYSAATIQEAEKQRQSSAVRRRIALSVNGSALAGAGLGAAVSHFAGSSIGIPAGAAVGAAVGGVVGGVGIVTAERMRAKRCTTQ